ncbi:MAG TPA: tRNA (adenosine(37)-N6)-dimethylallyltransferase MiaA [Candidatus Saccharimonadia bacterium]|nr:tRNA (adenosine(37)-N6)-dimethylallyltransferase MiaA [Candidatus Saccharimonadia bacterium]
MSSQTSPLITIVGPTGSGKTALALSLCQAVNGEVVCADSRTIYRNLNIGTAKPSAAEQAVVPHHLLDIIEPGERLSAGAFKALAEAAIEDIAARGRVPFLVGGSGLYVDAVLFDYQFPAEADAGRRAELEAMSDGDRRELLAAVDPAAYERVDLANQRRVIRAIETAGQTVSRRQTVRPQTLVLGLDLNKDIAQDRLEHRIENMLKQGIIDEVRQIGTTYGWDSEALNITGYRAFKDVALGQKAVAVGVDEAVREHLALVKKQRTWFKRNPAIHWLADASEAAALVQRFLAESRV